MRPQRLKRQTSDIAPVAERTHRYCIGGPGVPVPDLRSEEIDEREDGSLAAGSDESRHDREQHGIVELVDIEPIHVAAYVETLQATHSKPTSKQHLAAVRTP
jgi:hypothetical protein